MLLPIKAKNPPESVPYATVVLIAINLFVYAFTSVYGLEIREDVVDAWAFRAVDFPSITLLTSAFLHGDLFHILGNMWFLYLFGFAVEGRLRTGKFLLVYFASALGGDLMHYFIVGINEPNVPMIGASGAIMGVLGAALYMFPHSRINMFYWVAWFWRGVAEWAMWTVGLVYLGLDFIEALFAVESGVANLAHLGGALVGFLTVMALKVKRDDSSASEAKASLADMNDIFSISPNEAKQIALADPKNPNAALAWVSNSMRGNQRPTEDALAHLDPHIRTLVRSGSIFELSTVIAEFGGRVGRYHPRYVIDVALRAEHEGEAQSAARLLNAALDNPHLAASDREVALYQLAMIQEMWFQNYESAAFLYKTVYDDFVGSPLADQAMVRYKIVAPLAPRRP